MIPINCQYLLKVGELGHERPLTQIKYNAQGDLIFSCSKDLVINVWYSANGERLGTFDGHNGSVWTLDIDCEFLCRRRHSCQPILNRLQPKRDLWYPVLQTTL
jgi:WD40 repeat protein